MRQNIIVLAWMALVGSTACTAITEEEDTKNRAKLEADGGDAPAPPDAGIGDDRDPCGCDRSPEREPGPCHDDAGARPDPRAEDAGPPCDRYESFDADAGVREDRRPGDSWCHNGGGPPRADDAGAPAPPDMDAGPRR